jgi:hypothetical protein
MTPNGIKEDWAMKYWMNVVRGEWGFVENPKAIGESEAGEVRLDEEGPRMTGQPVPSTDGSVAWLLDKDSFLTAVDYLEDHAYPLAFSTVAPF